MKTKLPCQERDRKWHRIDCCVFLLLAVLFGSALVYLGILFFKMP
jgi:hypothetical protein